LEKEKGKLKWSKITGKNMTILIDKKLVTAPIIRAGIDQGKAIISGGFTQEKAEIIAEGIKSK
jgi:preprotein translocase subunit SecD